MSPESSIIMNLMFTLFLLFCASPAEGRKAQQVSPHRPLTKCQKEASESPAGGMIVPQCDSQGRYLPTQCASGFTAPCWCVNSAGEEIPGTRTHLGQPRHNCAGHPLTKCQKAASETPVGSVYVPQCDSQGRYLPTQCAGGFTAPCWCVNSAGEEIPGTRTYLGQPRHNCAGRPKTRCEQWRSSVATIQGVHHPQCDSQGRFLPYQCYQPTRYCWCVSPVGETIVQTLTPSGQPRPDCSVRLQTFCEYWRASVTPVPGAFIPQCDSQGQFLPTQCWGSTGYCWCVNSEGDGIPGTMTPPGQPSPNCAVVPLSFCQVWRNSVTHLPGSLVPECDSRGQFKPTQCWASTGYCWCFNPRGEVIPGTLTPPGQPRPTCE